MQHNVIMTIFGNYKTQLPMKQLSIKDRDLMQIALQQEILRSEESKYDHRLHGLLLITNGYDSYNVAKLFGQNPTTIQRWIKKFNKSGFSGLWEGERPGRPKSLTEKQWKLLGQDLRKDPSEFGYNQSFWDGKLMSLHLRKKFNVKLGVRQCQRVFKKMKFRFRKPRPVIANADPISQKALKKTPKTDKKSQG